ncbi:MAG TPA: hypothetical protein VFB80_10495 [Pirellulaceae bacterium]|nr:hypothetical protein [Pirellulaceae bacterium]
MSRLGLWRLASAPLLLLAPALASADEAEARAAIAKLLDVGWATTPQARVAADLQRDEVARTASGDPRALAAAWLVLLQQRRYDDGLKRIDEHLVRSPNDLNALRAKAWVQAILKNYPAALVSADKLSQQLAADPPQTEAEREDHKELIGFLGRLLGYLGGPVAATVNQEQRKAAEKAILARLEASRQPLFEDAFNGVLAKFIAMTDESSDARDQAVAAAVAEKDKTLAEIEADRQQAAARAKELEERRKSVQAEFQGELEQIAKEDRPLVQQLAQLDSRAAVLNRDLATYQIEIDRLTRLAAGENDPARRQQLLFEADRLAIVASRIEGDLVAANRLGRGVQAQRAALATRQAQAQSNANTQVQRIDRELTDLTKRERRNDSIEKRASRPNVGPTSKARALSAQATALSTYDQFPLEAAKAKLLESLR